MKTRWVWIVLSVIVVIAGGAWVFLRGSAIPVADVVELVGEGGEKLLRDPMRPTRGTTRVLIFALDGVGDDELMLAIRQDGAPNMARMLGAASGSAGTYANAYAVPGVLSILPSTTLAAWSATFTGEPAATNGVPGNEWFAREERRFYAPAPVTVDDNEDAIAVYTDGLVGRALRVPTLYEQVGVRSFVSLSQVHRGADLLTTPDLGALGNLVEAAAEGIAGEDDVEQEAYSELDRASVESLLRTLEERGIPDLQTIYFPGVDLYTHVSETSLAKQRQYLREVIDSAVGQVLDAYRKAGALDDTYILFIADHGHTPVLSDDRHSLGAEGDDEPTSLITRTGFRMREMDLDVDDDEGDDNDDDEQDFQAVVAYQGAMAYVYLADRSTCPRVEARCDWNRSPRWEGDVVPMLSAFDAANRTGAVVPALRGTIDLILSRPPRPVGTDALPFQVWDEGRLVPVAEYLTSHPRPDLLAFESRLEGLAAGPFGHRAGDILLLARSGMQLPVEDRYYFSNEFRSWHGSPTAQDSRIPLIVAHGRRSGSEIERDVRAAIGANPTQLSIAPLVRALLAPAAVEAGSAQRRAKR